MSIEQREKLVISAARNDPLVFSEYIFGVKSPDFHGEWHDAIDEFNRVIIFAPTESAKTEQIAVARLIWELGKNMDARWAIISATDDHPKKILAAIKEHIESNPRVRKVFPKLKPGRPWGEEGATIGNRTSGLTGLSLQAKGLSGNILGARLEGILLDDPCTFENTFTVERCRKTMAKYKSTYLRRVGRGKMIIILTAWREEDIAHQLEKEEKKRRKQKRKPVYKILRYEACDERFEKLLWPERFSKADLKEIAEELGEFEFRRQMRCIPAGDEIRLFKMASMEAAIEAGTKAGIEFGVMPKGARGSCAGIDIAVKKGEENDETVIITLALFKNGDRALVNIRRGRLQALDVIDAIVEEHHKWKWVRARFESNAAQEYARQWARMRGAKRLVGYNTGKEKHHPELGIQGLATEFDAGGWLLPDHPEVMRLVENMVSYSPSMKHTPDDLMALWLASIAANDLQKKRSARDIRTGGGRLAEAMGLT